jgi:16S rRNA (guanine1207-N2)-methyltransferase
LICEQSFKPDADQLRNAGFTLTTGEEPSGNIARLFSLVMLLPPRQRDESRALMARAVASLKPGGIVLASVSNNEGARSAQDDLERIAGPLEVMTKNKCRVFWTAPLQGPVDPALATEWMALDSIRPIQDGEFMSRPGVFAWDRIDYASALLAEHLPSGLAGHAADLGAGFGFLSAALLERCAGITSLDVYEAEGRALGLARRNLAKLESRAKLEYFWHDVTQGLPRSYDVIVSNPPFHTGSRADRPDVGRRFITAAAQSLRPGGRMYLVANRHLPYEQILNESFGRARTLVQQGGYKIIEGTKGGKR